MNKIDLIGRVSKEPELRKTESGTSIVNFNVAVQRNFKNSNGEYDTDFFNCRAFNKLAETINSYVKKGDRVGISGSIHFSKYQASDGSNRIATILGVDNIDFLEPKKEKEVEPEPEEGSFDDFNGKVEISDDDLPF